jgi:membrane-associated phospholipid phosphatase
VDADFALSATRVLLIITSPALSESLVRRVIRVALGAVLIACSTASAVSAQLSFLTPAEAPPQATPAPTPPAANEPSFAGRLIRDVGSDYKNFFSVENAWILGIGGAAALAVHPADKSVAEHFQSENLTLHGGEVWGSELFQMPLAVGWWAIGSAAGSTEQAAVGRDLLRAQIQAVSWTYAIKLATNRTRPNGDSHSFPSGHASTSFTTAMVLQEHFGWKVGVPAFAAAGYTAVSRLAGNDHWTSDVVFGAAIGIACGRTATLRLRHVQIAPVAMRRGGGVFVTAIDWP